MGFIPAFLMLCNVYIEVIRWCLQPQVTVYFDNHWYDNSIYRLIVHLFVDIWAYSIALVEIPPESSLPLLENCPQIPWPCTSAPPPPHPKSNLNHTLRKTRFSRGNSTWGQSSDVSLNENICTVFLSKWLSL